MANERGAVDLSTDQLSDEERAAVEALGDEHGVTPDEDENVASGISCETSFTVLVFPTGEVKVMLSQIPGVTTNREPNAIDFYNASAQLQKSMLVQEVASTTTQLFHAQLAAAAQQAHSEQIAQEIRRKGNLRG